MYNLSGRKIQSLLCKLMAFLVVTGCHAPLYATAIQAPPQSIAETTASQQLIIKFKPGTFACDSDGIAQLSSATQLHLEYIRPMSGDACVIKLLTVDTHESELAVELLRKHPAVEWVEPDSKKKAM